MPEENTGDQDKKDGQQPQGSVAQRAPVPPAPPPVIPPPPPPVGSSNADSGSPADSQRAGDVQPSEKELKFFEKETLRINQEAVAIGRNTARLAFWGVVIAALTGFFFYAQLQYMSDQTQILASQSKSAAAGAAMDELNTRKQLILAQDQFQIAKESFDVQFRPWLTVEDIKPIKAWQSDTWISLDVTLRNYGLTPANKVAFAFELRGEPVTGRIALMFKSVCEKSDAKFAQSKFLGNATSVFPGSVQVSPFSQTIAQFYPPGSHQDADLVGCVTYMGSGTNSKPYRTRLIFQTIWGKGQSPMKGIPISATTSFKLKYTEAE